MKVLPAKRLLPAGLLPTTFRDGFEELFQRFLAPFEEQRYPAGWPEVFRGELVPPMDVAETEKDLCVTLELPGLDEKDITVELMGNQLRVFGERKWEQDEKKKKDYHRVERRYGSFERVLALPDGLRLDRESISAVFKKGVLEIHVPKVEPTPSAKITVKPG